MRKTREQPPTADSIRYSIRILTPDSIRDSIRTQTADSQVHSKNLALGIVITPVATAVQ